MNPSKQKVRALGLCSGGLDSTLAGLVLRDQGIDVEWITFETPFFTAAKARKASEKTGIPVTVKPIYPIYINMLKNPPAGYGKQMNPCMDCHALMFKLAGEMMQEKKIDFLFSGEVLGQRPMSQNKSSLQYVEKHSGFKGYILRPLSAKNLPETIPEKEGLVNRERLLDFAGRGRKPQIALAKKYGLTDYPAPAGGCLLTDVGYSRRLTELFAHQEECTEEELYLLKYGRHFRLNPDTKLIVGRTEKDNENILKYHDSQTDTVIDVKDYPGPIALVPQGGSKEVIYLAGSICVSYSKASNLTPIDVVVKTPEGQETIEVIGIPKDDFKKLLI
jgi:tRNA U34 2-thiouridine synthase MnmA/TrmU